MFIPYKIIFVTFRIYSVTVHHFHDTYFSPFMTVEYMYAEGKMNESLFLTFANYNNVQKLNP